MTVTHPFEVAPSEVGTRVEELIDATLADLQAEFLVLPRGPGYVEFADFQAAYETLKVETGGFTEVTAERLWTAVTADARVLLVVRAMLGFSMPEWAVTAESGLEARIPRESARAMDRRVRQGRSLLTQSSSTKSVKGQRVRALLEVAARLLNEGAPPARQGTIHRLAKVDTTDGLVSVRHAANLHVPYAVLLYERLLGRPFASHRDTVSELMGDEMEGAVEAQLAGLGITYRKTGRAEQVAGFDLAPDFFVPTEFAPAVIIETKLTNDDGTAREKVARLMRLAEMRDRRERFGLPSFEVVACVDGRGFGVRRQPMRQLIVAMRGKVFTFATLDRLVGETRLREFVPA